MTAKLKPTSKHETIRPYDISSDHPWSRIAYRYDSAEPWHNVLASSFIALPPNRDDARTDVQHAFEVEINLDSISANGIAPGAVDFLILARDTFAKRVLEVTRIPVREGVISATVARSLLQSSNLAGRIDFHLMLVSRVPVVRGNTTIRRGGRLSEQVVSVSADRKGHSFHFSKTSPEEFANRGLPSNTTYFLDYTSARDLVEPCDDVAGVLSVLIHEDAWSTLQEIKGGDRAGEAVGLLFIEQIVVSVLQAAATALIDGSTEVEEGSIAMRLVAWLADVTRTSIDELKTCLHDPDSFGRLQALVQAALRLTQTVNRVRLEEEFT